MSHFTEIEVDFDQKHEKELVAALEEQFGEGSVEVHENGADLFGYQGDNRAKASPKSASYAPPCEIVIRRKHVGSAANDVGYKRSENGKYTAYVSEFDAGHTFTKPRQQAVAQNYGVAVAVKTLKAEGWKVHTQKLDNGSVKVVAKDQVKLKNW
jgi:hypothetical protein